MAKNRVMAEKNARVLKADIERTKERRATEIRVNGFLCELPAKVLEQADYVPNYKKQKRNYKVNSVVYPKTKAKSKSAAKMTLLARLA